MKKAILKVFGLAALAAGMMYNVQMSDVENGSVISLAALGNVAVAQDSETSGDFKDKTGCTATTENVSCVKDGVTHTFAYSS